MLCNKLNIFYSYLASLNKINLIENLDIIIVSPLKYDYNNFL